MSRPIALIFLCLTIGGCAWVRPVPTRLPFPSPPAISFHRGSEDDICLSEEEAAKLGRWLDQVRAFRHAWERLAR
ncbi:MAG: hypothetical protein A3J75_00140 [Acidobacteria bacterium RBG_16_68_9]|nr:MAG: hypothetical protein A3J75_00140 [Acidobacteria bacterium RBG_16_68_9]